MTDTVAAARPQSSAKGADASVEELLKQAVSGTAKERVTEPPIDPAKVAPDRSAASAPVTTRRRLAFGRVDARTAALGGVALGLIVGAGSAALLVPRGDMAAATLTQVKTEIGAARAETAQVGTEVGRLSAAIVKSGDRAAEEGKSVRTDLTQRMARMEQVLAARIATLADRQDAADREQAARLSSLGTLIEKRAAALAAVPPVAPPQAAKPASPEPAQTGSIGDTKTAIDVKPKPSAVTNWAVREVYDGIAVLEDRKRRLVEVARGDIIPGLGRAESIERRGRTWVVVTKDGLITPQEW